MRARDLNLAILVAALLAAACGGGGEQEAAAVGDSPPSTPAATAPEVSEPSAGEEEEVPEEAALALPDLPTSGDPCREPVEFAQYGLEEQAQEFGFEFRQERRPVGIAVSSPEALIADDTIVWLLLHGGGGVWKGSQFLASYATGEPALEGRPTIFVLPQSEPGSSSFWSQDESFNVDYLVELRSALNATLCLDRATILLGGFGQGTLAAVQGYCAGVVSPDVLFLWQGMVKLLDCPATDPVPIVSTDLYEFDPIMGNHWEGSWDPPVPFEVEATGGIESTPDDLQYWARSFGCESEPEEETLPSPSAALQRPTTVLAYRSCDVPLVAFGYQNAEQPGTTTPWNVEPIAVEEAQARIAQELVEAMK